MAFRLGRMVCNHQSEPISEIVRQTSLRVLAAENLLQRGPAAVGKADIIAEALDVRVADGSFGAHVDGKA